MRYVIVDKYRVESLKDASWDLIKLALVLIYAGTESFDYTQPFRAEEVRNTGYITTSYTLLLKASF